jgi:hypothetical protein
MMQSKLPLLEELKGQALKNDKEFQVSVVLCRAGGASA